MLSTSLLIFIGGCLLRGVGASHTWMGALFKSFALLSAAPGVDSVNQETTTNTVATNLLFLMGIFTFATVLGIITSSIEEHVHWVLEANHRVVERDHTVILNWSERTLPILRQLAESRRTAAGYTALPVVLMADKDVCEMREAVRVGLGLGALDLDVTVRSGVPTKIEDLEKVAIGHARNVLIMNTETLSAEDSKVQCVCVSILQQRCQPMRSEGFSNNNIHTVVVQSSPSTLPRRLGYTAVEHLYISQRILSSVVVQHGITEIYYDILTEGVGVQLYVSSLSLYPWLRGIPFARVSQLFTDAVCLGWLRCASPPETVTIRLG